MPAIRETASALCTVAVMTGVRGKLARLVVQETSPAPGDHVLDIGCGPGTAVRAAARAGAEATGVDPAETMLWLARKSSAPRCTYYQGTAEDLPVADGSTAIAWSIASVHHWQDLPRGLAEVVRVLAPGGRVLLVERLIKPEATGFAAHGLTEAAGDDLLNAMTAAGLTEVRRQHRHTASRDLALFHASRPA